MMTKDLLLVKGKNKIRIININSLSAIRAIDISVANSSFTSCLFAYKILHIFD